MKREIMLTILFFPYYRVFALLEGREEFGGREEEKMARDQDLLDTTRQSSLRV
jgi:hypothetical protein